MGDEKKQKEKEAKKISVTNIITRLERRNKEIVREVHPTYYHFQSGVKGFQWCLLSWKAREELPAWSAEQAFVPSDMYKWGQEDRLGP